MRNMQKIDSKKTGNRFEILLKKLKGKLKPVDYIFKIFLIVILLFLILEFFSFIVISFNNFVNNGEPYISSKLKTDVFSDKEWAEDFLEEYIKRESEYYPYVEFRLKPFKGKYFNINSDSTRKTDNPCKNRNSIRIFMFGGSATFSPGTRDNNTIPSYISRKLCAESISVEVTNFGQVGYVNSQEMIQLLLELRSGNIPDYVIFYDGFNEVYSSYQNKIAGLPMNLENRRIEFGSRYKFNLIIPLTQTNFMQIITTPKLKTITTPIVGMFPKKKILINNNLTDLAYTAVGIYLQNKKTIDLLGAEYNYTAFYFWQPAIYTKKVLSDDEKRVLSYVEKKRSDSDIEKLFEEAYKIIGSYEGDRFYDLSLVFDNINNSIYYDNVHVSDEGNEIIANRMVDLIKNKIQEDLNAEK